MAFAAGFDVGTTLTHSAPWQQQVITLGEVRSLAGAVLHAPIAGRLAGPFAAQGAQVERGTVLARITPPGQAARLDADTHRLALARETLARAQVLSRSHAVSVAQLQDAASRVATAADALSAARAAATAATLTAPVSGTVHYLLASGTEVGSGTAVLRVDGTGRVWIRGYVSPGEARQLHTGAVAQIHGDGWKGPARISAIGEDARHDGLVAVLLQPSRAGLLPGEWLHVALPGASGQAWRLPASALVMSGTRSQVFTVVAGRARAVPVRLVHMARGRVWVTGPLHEGEPIIAKGAGAVADGTRVDASAARG